MKVTGLPFVEAKWSYGKTPKYGIAIHNTSNDATAAQEASYASRRTDGTSCHFFVDKTQVIQVLDTAYKAGHAGSSTGNANAIAIEICGVNSWTRSQWVANVNFAKLGKTLASVIKAHWPDGSFKVARATISDMESNPRVKKFYSHDDMRRAWGGTSHTDPGPNFPWDVLFKSVNAALSPTEAPEAPSAGRTLKLTSPYMTGDDVKICQRFVGVEEDGVYGPITAGGVKRWQPKALLPVDGEWKAIERATAETHGRQALIKTPKDDKVFLTFYHGGERVRLYIKTPADLVRWESRGIKLVEVADVALYGRELQ